MMMKGKRPTKGQKVMISRFGYHEADWLVVKDKCDVMIIVHRRVPTKVRILEKGLLK